MNEYRPFKCHDLHQRAWNERQRVGAVRLVNDGHLLETDHHLTCITYYGSQLLLQLMVLIYLVVMRRYEHCRRTTYLYVTQLSSNGAYKFGKIKFPEFSRFSRPSKQLLPDNYKEKTPRNKFT